MKRGLEIKLLNYFLLITVAAMMIGVEFFFEMNHSSLVTNICNTADTVTTSAPLQHLRNKIVIMFGVLTVVVAIVLMMFIKNITWPLQQMVNVAERINDGDLNQVVDVRTSDELGQLGMAINDLNHNLQEMAVFTATTSKAIQSRVAAMAARCDNSPEMTVELCAIANDLQSLHEFAALFHTNFDAHKSEDVGTPPTPTLP